MTDKSQKNEKLKLSKYIDEVSDFYKLPKVQIDLHLVNSRQEMDKLYGRQTKDWLVAFVEGQSIYIFDKPKFADESTHPISDFEIVLRHEVSHVFFKRLKPDGFPNWLDEGVACYIAGQNQTAKFDSISLATLKRYNETSDDEIYDIGSYMVGRIIEEYGKDKLFELISLKSYDDLYNQLRLMFKWVVD